MKRSRTSRMAPLVTLALPLVAAFVVAACSSEKGTCTRTSGTGETVLSTNVSQGKCDDLCQERFMTTDCKWEKNPSGSSRLVEPL